MSSHPLRAFPPAAVSAGLAFCFTALSAAAFELKPALEVDGQGVFLSQVANLDADSPACRLCDAPAWAKTTVLTRTRIEELAQAAGCTLTLTNWTGADAVRISRRSRKLGENEALQMLTDALQQQSVRDQGQLELRFGRAWQVLTVPDEPLTLKVLDVPTAGVMPQFIARCELETARGERLGPWQAALQAHVWREVWVARSVLKRGDPVSPSTLDRDRRDMLLCHEPLAALDQAEGDLEAAEPLPAGALVPARAVKLRPVVRRGQNVAATLTDGTLAITLKVEVLEDGAPGQVIRVRNPISRRDLRGKVLDEQTIQVLL